MSNMFKGWKKTEDEREIRFEKTKDVMTDKYGLTSPKTVIIEKPNRTSSCFNVASSEKSNYGRVLERGKRCQSTRAEAMKLAEREMKKLN